MEAMHTHERTCEDTKISVLYSSQRLQYSSGVYPKWCVMLLLSKTKMTEVWGMEVGLQGLTNIKSHWILLGNITHDVSKCHRMNCFIRTKNGNDFRSPANTREILVHANTIQHDPF